MQLWILVRVSLPSQVVHSEPSGTKMGLDGGTVISRSDVLRGQSWAFASRTDQSRSTRGGDASTSAGRPQQPTGAAEKKCVEFWWACDTAICRLSSNSTLAFLLQNSQVDNLLADLGAVAKSCLCGLLGKPVQQAQLPLPCLELGNLPDNHCNLKDC